MKTVLEFLRRLWKADPFSPTAFVTRAVLIAVFFGISELLGCANTPRF